MEQIKRYLSKIYDIKKVLLLTESVDGKELEQWLFHVKRIEQVCDADYDADDIDAIVFDYSMAEDVLRYQHVRPRYVIGRMRKEEDYFSIWEQYREIAEHIMLKQDRDLDASLVNADNASCEILEWDKGDDIEVSVILPVYNVESYLSQCIESLTRWKAPYVEFLFINDGSTDNSADIILAYAEKDSRIHLINKENGGCASARNRGIDEARGRYIGFVDSDDFIDESMFYKLFKRALMGNYEYTYCGYKEYYEDTGESEPVLNDCLKDPYLLGTYRADKVQLLTVKTRVAIWRGLYKKKVLQRSGIRFHEDLKRFDDLPFRVEYTFAATSAACIPEYLYYYRLGRKGQDVACRDERLFVHFRIFEHLDTYVDAFKDKRLQDLLQIVKMHTHDYALSRIEKHYKKEYKKLARRQIDRNMGYFRTVSLIMLYTGKRNLGWYTALKLWGKNS